MIAKKPTIIRLVTTKNFDFETNVFSDNAILISNARLSRVHYGLPLQPIVPERESAREGIIALGSAGRSRIAQRFGNV